MDEFTRRLRTGAFAGASTSIVLTILTIPIALLIATQFAEGLFPSLTTGRIFDILIILMVRAIVGGALLGVINAAILSLLTRYNVISENLKGSLTYGVVSGVLFGALGAYSLSLDSLTIEVNMAYIAVFGFISSIFWSTLWSYWFGKEIFKT